MVAWFEEGDAGTYLLRARRYVAGQGWGPIEPVGTDNALTVTNPRIAVDRDGNALAVWLENALSPVLTTTLWARRYAAGSGWGAPERIGPGAGWTGRVPIDTGAGHIRAARYRAAAR